MIVVKIELWPKGNEDKAKEIGRMTLANDFFRTARDANRGDYEVRVMRRGTKDRVQRSGTVKNYPRNSYSIWRLIYRALKETFPEEKP